MLTTVDCPSGTRANFRDKILPQKPYSHSNPPETPIYMCPLVGDFAALRYHLSSYRHAYNLFDDDTTTINGSSKQTGDTALHLACLFLESPKATIKVLVELGADVNQKNMRGYTPVMVLVSSNTQHCYEAVKYLVRRGARIPVYIPSPITPLDSAQLYAINLVNESRKISSSGGNASPTHKNWKTYWKSSRLHEVRNVTRARPLIHVVAAIQNDDRVLDCLCEAGLDPALTSAEETTLVAAAAHLKIKNIEWLLNNDLEVSTEANIQRAIDVVKALHVNPLLVVNPQRELDIISPLTNVGKMNDSVPQELLNRVRDLRKYSWTGVISGEAADRLNKDMVGPVLDLLEQWTGDRLIANRREVATKLMLMYESPVAIPPSSGGPWPPVALTSDFNDISSGQSVHNQSVHGQSIYGSDLDSFSGQSTYGSDLTSFSGQSIYGSDLDRKAPSLRKNQRYLINQVLNEK